MPAKKKPMLHHAQDLIHGERQKDYGDKLQNFAQISMLWTATLGPKLNSPITPDDVAMCMMQVKIARMSKTPTHKDSNLDVAGYAGCLDILQDERDNNAKLPGMLIDYGRVG